MSRSIGLAVIVFGCIAAFETATQANRNFIPDWTFTGSSLADAEQLGDARWTAQNGELTGSPSSPQGNRTSAGAGTGSRRSRRTR